MRNAYMYARTTIVSYTIRVERHIHNTHMPIESIDVSTLSLNFKAYLAFEFCPISIVPIRLFDSKMFFLFHNIQDVCFI